jgi:hypothetical protein
MLGHELVEGGFEGDFFADDQAFSELGLGLSQRHRWDTALALSFGQLPGVLLGIQLICEGAALGYLAWQVRSG